MKSSQQTEHCNLATHCSEVTSTTGKASITSLETGGGPVKIQLYFYFQQISKIQWHTQQKE